MEKFKIGEFVKIKDCNAYTKECIKRGKYAGKSERGKIISINNGCVTIRFYNPHLLKHVRLWGGIPYNFSVLYLHEIKKSIKGG